MFCPLLGGQFKKSNYLEGIEHSASGFYAFNCVYVQHYILITQKELYQKCYHSWKFWLLSEKKKIRETDNMGGISCLWRYQQLFRKKIVYYHFCRDFYSAPAMMPWNIMVHSLRESEKKNSKKHAL